MMQTKQTPLPAAAVEGEFTSTSDKVIALLSLLDKRETKGAQQAKRALVVHSAFCSAPGWEYDRAVRRPTNEDGTPTDATQVVFPRMGRRQAEEAIEAIKLIVEEPGLTGYGARALAAMSGELEEFLG